MERVTFNIIAGMLMALFITCQMVGVNAQATTKIDDAQLNKAVINQLKAKKEFKKSLIHVETINGVVHLTGFVKTLTMKRDAAFIASRVSGVRVVKNDLVLFSEPAVDKSPL